MNASLLGRRTLRRRFWLIAAALLLLGVASLGGYWAWRHVWARQHFAQAQTELGRHNYAAATDHLVRCLECWPDDRATLLLAARTARRANRLREAQRLQDLFRKHHGDAPELRLERGLLEAQAGRVQDLELFLQGKVAENHPDTDFILEALIQGYVKTYRIGKVYNCANALIQRQPDHAPAWVWRGWAWEQLNREEDALADYGQALVVHPDYAAARISLGVLLLDLGRYPEALEHFQWLYQHQPDDPDIGLGMARCLRSLGEGDQARRLLEELVAAFPSLGLILSERGQLALEEGQPELAERWLRQAVALVPNDALTHYSLYLCLRQQGKEEEADQHHRQYERIGADYKRLKELELVMSKPGPHSTQRCEAGILCLRLGQNEEGERHLLTALQDDPTHAPAHQALAEYYEKTGQSDRATQHRAISP